MLINYYGHSYFLIKGKDYSVALDPFSNIGLPEKEVEADYVFSSHNHFDHNNVGLVKGAKVITKSGGAFEIIPSYHDEVLGAKRGANNVLRFVIDGKVCVFLGDIGIVDKNVVDGAKGCDYLFIPVGGIYTVNYVDAKKYVDEIKPKCVIPMHYKIKGCTVDVDGVERFLSLFSKVLTVNSPFICSGNEKDVLVIKGEF